METILSTRLKDEDFRGIINFMQSYRPGTSIEEIEKALVSHLKQNSQHKKDEKSMDFDDFQKYLYDDVPKAECSA